MPSQEHSTKIRVEVRADYQVIDYPEEYLRMRDLLGQLLYEFRSARIAGEVTEKSVVGYADADEGRYEVSSRTAEHVRIVNGDESYAFEAEFKPGAEPDLREYSTDTSGITEAILGADAVGCNSIAKAARLLIRAGASDR